MKYQYYKSVIQPFGPLANVIVPPFTQSVSSDYFLVRSSSLQPIQATFASLPPSKTKTNFYGENATLFGQSDYYIVPDTLVPFTIYSSSVNSGVTQVFQTLFLPNYELNDLHRDTYGDSIQAPLQSPFTEGWVGGNFQRHIEINRGTDNQANRPEAFFLLISNTSPALGSLGAPVIGLVDPTYTSDHGGLGYDKDIPRSSLLYRLPFAKRPVNIRNIQTVTSSNRLGNFTNNYEVIMSRGRTINDLWFRENSDSIISQTELPFLNVGISNPNFNETLPVRTPNRTIMVNRFSSPGGSEQQSIGYLDAAHAEKSIYSALNYKNLRVIYSSGSGNNNFTGTSGPRVSLYTNIFPPRNNDGLNVLNSTRRGKFGTDSVVGSVSALNYNVIPSYHKVYQNPAFSPLKSSSYDNVFVQHQIPRSEANYAWITASMSGTFNGGLVLSAFTVPSGSTSVTQSFVPLREQFELTGTHSVNYLGYSDTGASLSNIFASLSSASLSVISTSSAVSDMSSSLNYLRYLAHSMFGGANFMLHRKHDNISVKKQREQNKILYLNQISTLDKSGQLLLVDEVKTSIEPAAVTKFKPLSHNVSVDGKNIENKYSYGTELFRFFDLDLFSKTKGTTNKKVSNYEIIKSTYLDQRFDFLDSEFNYLNYNEVVYPGGQNTYRAQVRTRTNFSFNAWKNSRAIRATTDYLTAYGYTLPSSSVWNLDSELKTVAGPAYTLTSSGANTLQDVAAEGELQNHRSLFHKTAAVKSNSGILTSPLYARPILSGGFDPAQNINKYVVGTTQWETPTGAGTSPYIYSESSYDERTRLVGKDYSIVPEFRISNHIHEILINSNDYLRDFDKYFDLPGGETNVSSSNSSQFFNTYMHSDFLQYFDVIQKEHNGVGETDEIEINCNAIMKFLPYEGFYPAQRTRDIANLLSSSYSAAMQQSSASFRVFQQPFVGPGILYNSIKSGLSLAHPVCTRSAGPETVDPTTFRGVPSTTAGKFTLIDGTALFQSNFKYVPFESLIEPEKYTSKGNGLGTFYEMETVTEAVTVPLADVVMTGNFDNRYKMAINNFLAETMNMFIDPVESGFMFSLPENRFGDFVPGQVYSMQVTFNKELENYSRDSAYGPAIAETTINTDYGDSYDMFLPPYNRAEQTGQADQRSIISWKLHITASAASMTADEILSAMTSSYIKANGIAATLDSATEIQDWFIIPEQCFNVTKVAISRTDIGPSLSSGGTPVHSIMIQPKWQSPILDFSGVSPTIPTLPGAATNDPAMYSVGMWHQYGQLPGKKGTVKVSISPFASETDNELSLADKLGLNGQSLQLGRIKNSFEAKEAIVAIPFIDDDDPCPQYFKINHNIIKDAQSQLNGEVLADNREFKAGSSVVDMVSKMGNYVIPPKFDFLTFKEVDPMAMYIFEFSHKFSQKDLSNIWQNVSPTDGALDGDITNSFKTAGVNIKHKINNSENTVEKVGFEFPAFSPSVKNNNVRWLVFKVKQKAKKDYYDTLANIPRQNPDVVKLYPSIERVNYPNRNINSPVSYNWPYDYFSMVELVKIDTDIKINKKNEEA